MLVYEYKLDGNQKQCAVIEEAIRRGPQFIRNKCLRLWMDGSGVSKNDLRPLVLSLLKDSPLPLASTPKLVKLVPTVHGSLSIGSTPTAANRSQGRKGIRNMVRNRKLAKGNLYCLICKDKVTSSLDEGRTPVLYGGECQKMAPVKDLATSRAALRST